MAIHPQDVVCAICWKPALSIFSAVYGQESCVVVCTRVVSYASYAPQCESCGVICTRVV